MVLSHLAVTEITHSYIITAARAALDSFIINNIKGVILRAERYLIIKRSLFGFKKKFATANNKRKYCDYKE